MAGILGIQQYFTTHLWRKRAATNRHRAGWAVPPIASMLGNTEKVCRTDYIESSKENILVEIARVDNKKPRQDRGD